MSVEFYWLAVALVAITSAARLTRLLVADKFPPVMYLRMVYLRIVDRAGVNPEYGRLVLCGWCMSFWAFLAVGLWGYLTDFNEPWFVANGLFGGSYLAAMLMARDGDSGEDDD